MTLPPEWPHFICAWLMFIYVVVVLETYFCAIAKGAWI